MVFSRRMNDIRIYTQVLRYLDAETDVDAHRHQAVSNFGRGESSSSTSTLPSLGSFRRAPKVPTSCPLSLSLGQLVATCGQPPSHKGGELHSPFSSCESTLDTTSLKDAPIGLEPERRPGQDGRYWGRSSENRASCANTR